MFYFLLLPGQNNLAHMEPRNSQPATRSFSSFSLLNKLNKPNKLNKLQLPATRSFLSGLINPKSEIRNQKTVTPLPAGTPPP